MREGGARWIIVAAEATATFVEAIGYQIAVEIKSFLSTSVLADLERALGQHSLHRAVLNRVQPKRRLYLAVPQRVYDGILSERLGQLIVQVEHIALVVFDELEEKVVEWIPSPTTAP